MSKGGTKPAGSTTVTQNTSTAPWTGVQPSLENIYSRAEDAYQSNPLTYYPYQTLATPNSHTSSIYGSLASFGDTGAGSTMSTDALNYQENALLNANAISSGKYLNNQGQTDLLRYAGTPNTSYAASAAGTADTLGSRLPSYINSAAHYGSDLAANPYVSTAADNPYISGLSANPYTASLAANPYVSNAGNNPYLSGIMRAYDPSIGTGENYLGNFAAGNTDPYIRGAEAQMLGLGSSTPAATQAGEASLGKTASGAYLNSNPYLDSMFGSAAGNVTRAYQTATAPQTDANFEAAGRYGSGALANARSQNQLDLGQTLNNLASNIYGGNYANERGLQTTAANQLAQTGIAGLNAQSSDLYGLGNIGNANTSNMVTAANNTGSLGLGNLNALVNQGYNAGSLYNSGQLGAGNLLYNSLYGAGNQYETGLANAASAYNTSQNNAGSLYNTSLYGAGNIANSAASNLITGAADQGQLYNNAQSGLNNATANSINAASNYGSNYNYGVNNMLNSDKAATSLSGLPYQDALAGLYGSKGLTSLDQSTINDAMARYYGNELSNWDTLGAYANLINGGSGTGSTTSGSTSTPYYAPSTGSSILGYGLGGLSLGNGLFGSGGAFSGLFGSGTTAGTAAATGAATGATTGWGTSLLSGIGSLFAPAL